MRLLFVHCDYLAFEAREGTGPDGPDETADAPMDGRMEECVAVFVSVESGDAADTDAAVANAADELRCVTGRLNTEKVVLYPSTHFSDDLADPDVAGAVLRGLEAAAEADGFEALRAPFRDASVEMSSKGHPFSERSRRVSARRDGDDAEGEPSEWRVVWPDGTTADAAATKSELRPDLRALVEAETGDAAASDGEGPAHVDLFREQSFGASDDSSGEGGFRWYPRGKLVRDALIEYADDLAVEHGAMPVETPAVHDPGTRAVDERAGAVGERRDRPGYSDCRDRPGYSDRRTPSRSAACFGQFSIMRDADLAESDLPFRIYGTAARSPHRKQRGEAVDPARLRPVTAPEIHTATADLDGARAELLRQARLALEAGEALGIDYEPVLRATREFSEADEEWIGEVVAELGGPALVEIVPERRRDWSAKLDLATVNGRGRPIENATARIDVESAERFDVTYTDDEGSHCPPILHCSPIGGIERTIAALLADAVAADAPHLPTWLSPTQVRFLPVQGEHVDHCDGLADDLAAAGARADVDDRRETVGERIARAEADWVPYYVVVGDREVDGEPLGVNVRADGAEVEATVDELRRRVLDEVGDLPQTKRYLPKRVGDRPDFAGR